MIKLFKKESVCGSKKRTSILSQINYFKPQRMLLLVFKAAFLCE